MTGTQQTAASVQFLIREMFRAAHVPYQSDTKDVKAAEAIALEHRELNEMLHGIAASAQAFELDLARHFFQWKAVTPEAATAAFAAANVRISYPREFFSVDGTASWCSSKGLSYDHLACVRLRRARNTSPAKPLPRRTKLVGSGAAFANS